MELMRKKMRENFPTLSEKELESRMRLATDMIRKKSKGFVP